MNAIRRRARALLPFHSSRKKRANARPIASCFTARTAPQSTLGAPIAAASFSRAAGGSASRPPAAVKSSHASSDR